MSTTSVLRSPGNYIIVAGTGTNGGMVIDVNNTTGALRAVTTGTLKIYGNLDVIGGTTFIDTTNTNILDNILFLNTGDPNNYVTQATSGIAISRAQGNLSLGSAATLLYNDAATWSTDNITENTGVWELSVGDGIYQVPSAIKIQAVRTINSNGSINFLGKENSIGILNVDGTENYEEQVALWGDDAIPNKRYVDTRLPYGLEITRKVQVGRTFIQLGDSSVSPSDPYYDSINKMFVGLGTSTNVVFRLEGREALIQGVTLNDTELRVNGSRTSNNLIFTPYSNSGTVVVNSSITLTNSNTPKATSRNTQIWSTSTVGGGGTGLYFVNTVQQDELVSKKRAIIYGIIF
jgi:hypothetical protein